MILNDRPDRNRRPPTRDYQTAALKTAWRELKGKKAVQVVLPSGSGKTRVVAELADKFYRETGERTLIVAPMRELVLHAEREVTKYTNLSVSVEMAEQRARDTTVVCATKHTMFARLKNYRRNAFGLVVFDESDLAAADTYSAIKKYFLKAKVCGVTATPDRHDGREGIAPVVFKRELKEQIEAGILSRIRRIGIKIAEVSRAKLFAGDFDPQWLDEIFSREKHLHEVVKTMLDKADKRPTLVFGVTVLHAKLLANLFNRYRPGCARWISGKSKNQPETLEAFRRGDFQFLCNCMLVSRGVDVPPVACIGMAAPTLSHTKYLQMLGRGTRRSPGKKNLLVVDFTFNSDVHALDAVDAVAGEGKEEIGVRARERKRPEFDIVDVINEVEGELESNQKLRERIQAKVRVEWRRIKGINWNKCDRLLGTTRDQVIADEIGCPAYIVGARRRKLGIFLSDTTDWGKYDHLLGVVRDKALADKIGCSRHIVAGRRRRLGISSGYYKNLKSVTKTEWETMTNDQLARRYKCDPATVSAWRPENTAARSSGTRELKKLTDGEWLKYSAEQIAKKFGLHKNTVLLHRPKHLRKPQVDFSIITKAQWEKESLRQIAGRLRCSVSLVCNHRKRMMRTR